MDTKITFTITNGCSCTTYNEQVGEWEESPECWGDCWDCALEDFAQITTDLFDSNETYWWRVQNVRLWNGEVSGFIKAKDAEELIRGMGVNSHWIMRGEVFGDRIEYSLSHHDAPMGSASVVWPVTEDQREEWGLY